MEEYGRIETTKSTMFRWMKEFVLNRGSVAPKYTVVRAKPVHDDIYILGQYSNAIAWLRENTVGTWICELCTPILITSPDTYSIIVRFSREEDAVAFKLTWN